jgi:hypothetical protein
MSKCLFVLHQEADAKSLEAWCQEASLEAVVVRSAEEAVPFIQAGNLHQIWIEVTDEARYQHFETILKDSVGLFADVLDPNKIFFFTRNLSQDVPFLYLSPFFGSVFFLAKGVPLDQYPKLLQRSLRSGALPATQTGLGAYLEPGTRFQHVTMLNSGQKQHAVEAVRSFLVSAKFATRIALIIANTIDELLMNAIFDAPVDEVGRPLLEFTVRDATFDLEGQAQVDLHLGFDGEFVGISVSDAYGSLDRTKLKQTLSKNYRKESYSRVKPAAPGAGLGLLHATKSGSSLIFSSTPGVKTEVLALFPRTKTYKGFRNYPQLIGTHFKV